MRFENDYIRIIIEKKQLTIEQKETLSLRRKKRRPKMIVAALLICAIVGGSIYGHSYMLRGDSVQTVSDGTESGQPANVSVGEDTGDAQTTESAGAELNGIETGSDSDEGLAGIDTKEASEESEERISGEEILDTGEYVASTKLAAGLQEKYAEKNLYNYTYAAPIEDVGRAEPITFQLGYDVDDLQIEKWTEVFALYQDPELTYRMGVKYDFDPETGTFIMEPSDGNVPGQISLSGLSVKTVEKYPHNETYLHGRGAGQSWGNLGTAYLASYRDKETGELLEQPEVSIVTFEAEIEETPRLTYSVTYDGRVEFSWNEVEGAAEYFLCRVNKSEEKGYNNGSMFVIDTTESTSWVTEYPEYHGFSVNSDFCTFSISEDEWKDEWSYENNLERYGEPGLVYPREWGGDVVDIGICVVAVNEKGTSMVSNIYDVSEIAPKIPYSIAYNTERENGFASDYENVEDLPSYEYVTMCDGYTSTKQIDYQTEKAYVQDKLYIMIDKETAEYVESQTMSCLCIPYRIEGTSFIDEFTIVGPEEKGYHAEDFEKDIAYLEDKEKKMGFKSGDMSLETSLKFGELEEAVALRELRQVETTVFANSALSEYLAINMLAGNKVIDLSEFPEARDTSLVDDAFLEAYYQNPLILGIKGYKISKNGKAVRVVYEESEEDQAKKQKAIKRAVSKVIDEIISEDMTEQEKELAINQYLCDTIVYDEEALANAEENDFMYIDERFNDSFTAYGALIDGKCVCAGYAAAFRLLAEEAGLETIVVTGFLDGNLAHAWNKVKIDDEWQIVDVTNNDNEYFFNALLNLPSDVGDDILVEDEDYMMDVLIPTYTGETDEHEYYHITDNYFPSHEVAEILAEQLAEDGEATLRTDYELNDNEFYEITDAIYEIMGDEIELYGYYWLGVIYLSTEM